MLYNSEAWHSIVKDDIAILSRVHESLLAGLVSAHSKAPKEALFLETGTLPINYVLAARRLIYLQNILKRDNTELLKKVYLSQKANPKKGDFVDLVSENAKLVELDIKEEDIENMSKTDLRL